MVVGESIAIEGIPLNTPHFQQLTNEIHAFGKVSHPAESNGTGGPAKKERGEVAAPSRGAA